MLTKNSQNIFSFVRKLGIYLIISLFFSVVTSAGWTYIFFFIYGGAIYLSLFTITLIISLFLDFRLKKQVIIPNKFALFIIALQLFLMLFNTGECIPNFNKAGNFIQRLLISLPQCSENITNNWISINIILPGFAVNFILLIILVSITLSSARKY